MMITTCTMDMTTVSAFWGAFSVFPTPGPTSGLLNTSHLDELTQLEDSASPHGRFERRNADICFFNHCCSIALLSL